MARRKRSKRGSKRKRPLWQQWFAQRPPWRHWFTKRRILMGAIVSLLLVSAWGGRMVWRYRQAQVLTPDAIVVLGGGVLREIAAAQIAQQVPDVPIIVSGGSSLGCLRLIFEEQRGVDFDRVLGDYQARSTLTNFITLVPFLKSGGTPRKVWVVTEAGNWPRARKLGGIVFGSRGIAISPVLIGGPGSSRGESVRKTNLQVVLAGAWVLFGDWVLPPGSLNSRFTARQLASIQAWGDCTGGYPDFVPMQWWPY